MLIIPILVFAAGAISKASISPSSSTMIITNQAALTAAIIAANESYQAQMAINHAVATSQSSVASGMLACNAWHKWQEYGYIYNGCKVDDDHISIQQYFDRAKKCRSTKPNFSHSEIAFSELIQNYQINLS